MIGDHLVRRPVRAGRARAGQLLARLDDPAEQVDVVAVVHPLEHGGDALEPHAGVDRGPGQRLPPPRLDLLELHEHEVPDLDEAVAVLVGAARRPARHLRPVVVEDLGARAARSGIAHRPEIVRGGDAQDPALGQPRDLLPQLERLVVLRVDRGQQPVRRQAVLLGDQVPGELDRDVLEVVAEREVAEHLEEGVVPGGVADIVEVVVLAAGAHAFLRRGRAPVRPLLDAGEHVLELHHAGVGEQERRVVVRHERARWHDLVAVLAKILEEGLADVVGAAHGSGGNPSVIIALDSCPVRPRKAWMRHGAGAPFAMTTAGRSDRHRSPKGTIRPVMGSGRRCQRHISSSSAPTSTFGKPGLAEPAPAAASPPSTR